MHHLSTFHQCFDLNRWIKEFPLAEHSSKSSFDLVGPKGIALVEQARRQLKQQGKLPRNGIPCDLFVWNKGEPDNRELTKVGGLPCWPDSKPWPKHKNRNMKFVGQINFMDSRDIVPALPGDVLTVFVDDLHGAWQHLHYHWVRSGTKKWFQPSRHSTWEKLSPFAPCYGDIHRTVVYPDLPLVLLDSFPFRFARLADSTRIGGCYCPSGEMSYDPADDPDYASMSDKELERNYEKAMIAMLSGDGESEEEDSIWIDRYFYRCEMRKHSEFLCELSSINTIADKFPFLNSARDDSLLREPSQPLLNIVDAGSVSFFLSKKRRVYHEVQFG